MNHLREFIEQYSKKSVYVMDALGQGAEDVASIAVKSSAENAVCFFSELDSLTGMRPVKELCERLPYEVCWFEFQISEPRPAVVCVLAIEDFGKIIWIIFRKMSASWLLMASAATFDGKLAGSFGGENGAFFIQSMINAARVFITAMRCNNVSSSEKLPSKTLQSSRLRKGKKPLFSYWTLELKQERTEGDQLGGTHASPRLHLRRGHPRQYAPGKYTWVQPCVVGNKAAGMVHKDYRLAA